MAKRAVAVQILGREYRIRTDSDEDAVHAAAELVETTLGRVKGRAATVDTVDVAIMAALNLANQLIAQRDAAPPPVDDARLEQLSLLVESALDASAAS